MVTALFVIGRLQIIGADNGTVYIHEESECDVRKKSLVIAARNVCCGGARNCIGSVLRESMTNQETRQNKTVHKIGPVFVCGFFLEVCQIHARPWPLIHFTATMRQQIFLY